jgi:hypothetical protein
MPPEIPAPKKAPPAAIPSGPHATIKTTPPIVVAVLAIPPNATP